MDLHPGAAILESDGRAIRLTFLGRRRWALENEATAGAPRLELDNEGVVPAVLRALELEGPLPHDSRRVSMSTAMGSGWVRNNTFPASLWVYNAPNSIGVGTLETCLWSLLCALELWPPAGISQGPPLDLGSFSRARLLTSAAPETFCLDLEAAINAWLEGSANGSDVVRTLVDALRDQGYALALLDSDGARVEVWATDGDERQREPSLTFEMAREPYEPASCSVRLGQR